MRSPGWRAALDGGSFGAIANKQPARAGQVAVRRLDGDLQALLPAHAADVGDQRPARVQAVTPPRRSASGCWSETGQVFRVANDVQLVSAQSVAGEFLGEALGEHEERVGSLVGRVLGSAQQLDQRWASNHPHGGPRVDGQVCDFRDPGPALDARNESRGRGHGWLSADVEIHVGAWDPQGHHRGGQQGKRSVVKQAVDEHARTRRDVGRQAQDAHAFKRFACESVSAVAARNLPGWVVGPCSQHEYVVAAGGEMAAERGSLRRDAGHFGRVVNPDHHHTHGCNG